MKPKIGILAITFSCLLLYSIIYNLSDKLFETIGPSAFLLVFAGIGLPIMLAILLFNWIIGTTAIIFCIMSYLTKNKTNITLSIISICICGVSLLCLSTNFNETKFAKPSEEFKSKEVERIFEYLSNKTWDSFVIDDINYDFSKVNNNEGSFPWYGKSKNRYIVNLHKADNPNIKLVLRRASIQNSYGETIQINNKWSTWQQYNLQEILHGLLDEQLNKTFGERSILDINVDHVFVKNEKIIKNMVLDDYMGFSSLKDDDIDIVVILYGKNRLIEYNEQINDLCKFIESKNLKKARLNIQLYEQTQEQALRYMPLADFSRLSLKNIKPKEVCILYRDEIAKVANQNNINDYISDLATFLSQKKDKEILEYNNRPDVIYQKEGQKKVKEMLATMDCDIYFVYNHDSSSADIIIKNSNRPIFLILSSLGCHDWNIIPNDGANIIGVMSINSQSKINAPNGVYTFESNLNIPTSQVVFSRGECKKLEEEIADMYNKKITSISVMLNEPRGVSKIKSRITVNDKDQFPTK